MKRELESTRAFLFLLIVLLFLFAVAPASAQTTEERIKALEEVQRANAEELARLKGEQMELKKEATAAAAVLPTFTYRPGAGVTISAADRSWEWRISYLVNAHIYNAIDGNDKRGSTTGDIFTRRNRVFFTFWLDRGFYEFILTPDFDTGDITGQQNQSLRIHFEQLNPWFPTFMIGDRDRLMSLRGFERSSTANARVEDFNLDVLVDSNKDTLSYRGITLGWINKPVATGDFSFHVAYKPASGTTENDLADSDRKTFQTALGIRPFSREKNPWLERLAVGYGIQTDSLDSRSTRVAPASTRRLRLRTHERGSSRVTVFDTGNNAIGDGTHVWQGWSLHWGFGPYNLLSGGSLSRFASGKVGTASDGFKGVDGFSWEVAHELFLWSPKGFLTGSPTTPGSFLLGWAFNRSEGDCGKGADCSPGAGAFRRNRMLIRELAAWYFIRPAIRVGVWWDWYDTSNTPTGVQQQIGCRTRPGTDASKDCDWHTVNVGVQARF